MEGGRNTSKRNETKHFLGGKEEGEGTNNQKFGIAGRKTRTTSDVKLQMAASKILFPPPFE